MILIDVIDLGFNDLHEVRGYCNKHGIALRVMVVPDQIEYIKEQVYKHISYSSSRLTFYINKAKMKGVTLHKRHIDRLLSVMNKR